MVEMCAETKGGLYVACQLLSCSSEVKVKVEVSQYIARRHRKRVEVWLHSVLTSACGGGKWSAFRPGGLSPGEHSVPIEQEVDAPQRRTGRFGQDTNFLPLPWLEPWTVRYPGSLFIPVPKLQCVSDSIKDFENPFEGCQSCYKPTDRVPPIGAGLQVGLRASQKEAEGPSIAVHKRHANCAFPFHTNSHQVWARHFLHVQYRGHLCSIDIIIQNEDRPFSTVTGFCLAGHSARLPNKPDTLAVLERKEHDAFARQQH
jgi:hypothetical protein